MVQFIIAFKGVKMEGEELVNELIFGNTVEDLVSESKLLLRCIEIFKKIQNNCTFKDDVILIQTFITNGSELEREIERIVDRWEQGER